MIAMYRVSFGGEMLFFFVNGPLLYHRGNCLSGAVLYIDEYRLINEIEKLKVVSSFFKLYES